MLHRDLRHRDSKRHGMPTLDWSFQNCMTGKLVHAVARLRCESQIPETDFLNRLISVTSPPDLTNARYRKTDQSTDLALYHCYWSTGPCRESHHGQNPSRSQFDTIVAPGFATQAVVLPHPARTNSNLSVAAGKTFDRAGQQTLHLATDLKSRSNQTQRCPESASRAMETTAASGDRR